MPFNHNDFYHRRLLRHVPSHCADALDVGCGSGTFARRLARKAGWVDAIDASAEMIDAARTRSQGAANIEFRTGDLMDIEPARYDFVSCIATVHHLPSFPVALERLRDSLRPGGVLAVLGLYRERTVSDYALAAAAAPVNLVLNALSRKDHGVSAPVKDATLTFAEIRADADRVLPGHRVRRHLFWRYSLIYRKP
ncbi:Methyltransferase domain-containing protein [Allokutzneria albata]|uniref:Methyltransferase domain-containing protein n=2 Tax=Allokutzneria albata TaxID=211114 RepID=A0A1H0CT17_ALLAB|nr:Methyltransferase domain-containing protein [Allokutzneria albata]